MWHLKHFIWLIVKNTWWCISRFGIEGPVYITTKERGSEQNEKQTFDWVIDEEQQKIIKRDGTKEYKVLDAVMVHIQVVETQPNRSKLQLTLLT